MAEEDIRNIVGLVNSVEHTRVRRSEKMVDRDFHDIINLVNIEYPIQPVQDKDAGVGTLSTQNYGREGVSDNVMANRTIIFVDGQVRANEPVVDKLETTIADNGLQEKTEIHLRTAACGHVVHTGAQAGSGCSSCARLGREPTILCNDCAKDDSGNICYICHTPCCFECRTRCRIDDEMRVVCRACVKVSLWLKLRRCPDRSWRFVGYSLYS